MTDQQSDPQELMRLVQVARNSKDLYGATSLLYQVLKKAADPRGSVDQTNAGVASGVKQHLIDKLSARSLRDFNTTHSTCIESKASSTVGLGHRDQGIHDVLDEVCKFSWQDVLDAAADDFWETGECFIEVVYGDESDPSLVTALNHLESAQVSVEVEEEDNPNDFHYVVNGETGGAQTTVMARFGDLADLKARYGNPSSQGAAPSNESGPARRSVGLAGSIVNSEVIHIRLARNRSRWYGYPDYMSAVPSIELVQCMTQHEFDFYFNRGVPEFMLFLIGRNIGTDSWNEIKKLLQASQGLGHSHKTGAVHIPGSAEDVKVQIEKLAMEDAANSGFSDKSLTLSLQITTAHGVPPILANVLLPGKIGAANEGPNALMLIQKRKIGPAQRNFSAVLARTLGSGVKFSQPEGAPKALTAEQFLGKEAKGGMDENGLPIFNQPGNGFNTVLDGMSLGAMDTMSRMKEPITGSGRNPADGLLDGTDDRAPSDPRNTR